MSPNDWERFKTIILSLYLVEEKPLHEVARYMEKEHQFSKTKSQYEYQFKKWGAKKYAKSQNWKNLRHQLEKRAGKQSEVTLLGIPLSPGRVRKQMQRYTSIPTANEFGKRPRSPECLDGTIVRAQTPIVLDHITWPALPWFHFKNSILSPNTLRDPSAILRTLFAALGSVPTAFQSRMGRPFNSLAEIFRNPVDLRQTMLHLTNTIPDDDANGQEGTNTLAQEDSSLHITTEALKLIFFRLSNKMLPPRGDVRLRAHDQFVLHLVGAVSLTNPDMLSRILFDDCVTAKAIREAVYGSAIREKHYTIVSRLLESNGVDPNLTISAPPFLQGWSLERGLLYISRSLTMFVWSGMLEAAFTRDARLAKMLLRAGASLSSDSLSILKIACAGRGNLDSSTEFIQLLDEHGVINNYSTLCCCPCPGSALLSPIAMSIARSDNCMAKFLIEKFLAEREATMGLSQYSKPRRCGCCADWVYRDPEERTIGCMPLHLAIVMGNEEITGRLLAPVLSHPPRVSVRVVQEAFLFSCFAGDENTVLKLLARHPRVIVSTVWKGITPLVATAWNRENTTIAEALSRLGADIGPTRNDGLSVTKRPAPIHVAASYGNTALVQELLLRGADCNVRCRGCFYAAICPLGVCESALQLALENKRIETARLLIPHSRLLGRELMRAVALHDDALISDLISRGANITWADEVGRTVLEVASEMGNETLIFSYFSSGGTYTSKALREAIKTAIKSKDHSIVRLVASHRYAREIDDTEAWSLGFAIREREWDLVSLLHDSLIPGPAGSQRYDYCSRNGWPVSQTPLCAALLSENQSAIQAMIKRGYALHWLDIWLLMNDVNASVRQAFWDRFPLETMDLSFHRTLLFHAIDSGNTQKVREYIKIIDCLDFPCRHYYEGPCGFAAEGPLARAISHGTTEIVRILLDAGAGVNFVDPRTRGGKTALQCAAIKGHLHLVQLLLDRGARVDPAAQLEEGATALQYSAINGHLKVAQLLVSRGADINAPPAMKGGRTALEGASEHGRLDMVQFLLKMGAKIDGQMRIYYVRSVGFAKRNCHHIVANYLMEYGSWGCRDEKLHDDPLSLFDNVYFLYEEVTDEWRVRRRQYEGDDGYFGEGLSEFWEFANSSSGSEEDESEEDESEEDEREEDGVEENERNKCDGGELYSASYETDCILQAWRDNMDLTMAEPCGLYTIGTQTMAYGSASSQMSTTQRVIEVDDIVEDADVAQFDVDYNVENRALADDGTTNQLELWGPRNNLLEGLSEFGMDSGVPGINFVDGRVAGLDGTEIEWEGLFSGVGEAEAESVGPFSEFHGFGDIGIYEV